MDEVDELLLEQELLSPTSATKTMNKISSKHQLSQNESPDKNKKKDLKESLRDSTLEKLLNGEDLSDLDLSK